MEKELVSVIMTVYNGEKYLKKTIESILTQTYDNFEFLILDDGSTDNSNKIILEYKKIDKRIKVFNKGRVGRAQGLNYLVSIAKGKYVANIDSDDFSYKKRLEKEVEFLEKNKKIVLVGTGSNLIDEEDKIIQEKIMPLNYEKIRKISARICPFNHSSVMFRKKEVIELGNYNKNLKAQIDYDLWIRIIKEYEVANLKEILSTKRVHSNQYFEQGILKINYGKLFLENKLSLKAIKELKLSKINYIYISYDFIKYLILSKISTKNKLYLKKLLKI
ncbi:MAG: glycosyltransferase [Fusobacterium sp.]